MNTRIFLGGLAVLAFIVFGVTLYYSFAGKEERQITVPTETEEVGYVPDVVNARHQFKSGVHTIVGEVDMPTPCDVLESEAVVLVREPAEDQVTVQFTTIHEGEVCAQMLTPVRFKTTWNAGEKASIHATWNGAEVRLNLVDVGPEEDIDDFDLYFKG